MKNLKEKMHFLSGFSFGLAPLHVRVRRDGENRLEIIGSALLVLVLYSFFDNQSKLKKLEKRIEDLEKKNNKDENE